MKDITALLPGSVLRELRNADLTSTVTGCPGIGNHATQMASTFTSMVADLQNGDATLVIRYINRGSIRADVEAIVGYVLSPAQAIIAGRQSPCYIEDEVLSRACCIARELQAIRASARKTCQMYQAHGIGSTEFHRKLTTFIDQAITLLEPSQEYQDDAFYECSGFINPSQEYQDDDFDEC